MTRRTTLCLAAAIAPAAAAQDTHTLDTPEVALDIQTRDAAAATAFGLQGQSRLTIGGGVALEFEDDDESTDYNLHVGWSHFIVDDWEFRVELGAWYFDQDPDPTWGASPAFQVRWHFLNTDPWTVYADAGIGLLLAADDVPSGGSSVDFMPRIGAGVTHRINPRGDRLEFGLRWHHISNARVVGDSNNPDRDGVMFYAGISFPL